MENIQPNENNVQSRAEQMFRLRHSKTRRGKKLIRQILTECENSEKIRKNLLEVLDIFVMSDKDFHTPSAALDLQIQIYNQKTEADKQISDFFNWKTKVLYDGGATE